MKYRLRSVVIRLLALLLRPLVAPARPKIRRILVIKPDHLGDVLLLTPALSALPHEFPHAHISVLIGPWSKRLLLGNPDLDALLLCAFPGFVRGQLSSFWQPYRTLLRYAALLRAGRYDAVLLVRDDHWWGGLLALAAGINQRLGYAHPLVQPTLTTALPWDATAHVTTQALGLVAALAGSGDQGSGIGDRENRNQESGSRNQESGRDSVPLAAPAQPENLYGAFRRASRPPTTCFYPTPAEHAWAEAWLAMHSAERPLLAIQPGSGGAAKLWPAANWATVAHILADYATVVLTGGTADAADVQAISALLDVQHHTLVGAASLGELAALFGRCALVLGVDNGPLHLAVSQNTPTIHLFGPGDHGRFGPWGAADRHVVLRSGLWCSPCGVLSHCPRKTSPSECMTTLDPTWVISEARRLLASTSKGVRDRGSGSGIAD